MIPPSDDEIREELEHHLASRAELNASHGMTPSEADRRARLSFGNATLMQEDTRSVHRFAWLDDFRLDLTHALRSFRRNPSVPLAALFVLTLGIGASTAVFSVIDRTLFRPLPYAEPERLVSFGLQAPLDKNEFMLHPDFFEWRAAAPETSPFLAMASTRGVLDCDLTEGAAQRLVCGAVDAGMIPLLGLPLQRGGNFTDAQDLPNGPRAAILGDALWRGRFGAREDIIGKTIQLDGQAAIVMGLLPPNYTVPSLGGFDLLVPQQSSRGPAPNGPWLFLRAFGRLKPGWNNEQAKQALAPSLHKAMQLVPESFRKEVHLRIRSLQEREKGDFKAMSWLLLSAVLAVFAIACANLCNLLVARNAARESETAIRLAIGASRPRLVRQLLAESLFLSSSGAISGTVFAWLLLRVTLALAPAGLLTPADTTMDYRVISFTVAMAAFACIAATLFPVFQLPRSHALNARHGRAGQPRLRLMLVTLQIAVSLVLCTSAALLLRSLWVMQSASLGFQTSQTLFAEVSLGRHGYQQPEQRAEFFNSLEESLRSLPSVSAVSISDSLPPSGRQAASIFANMEVEGRPRLREGTGGMVAFRTVSESFFPILGIAIQEGRSFTPQDRQPGNPTVILNRLLANRLFGAQSPAGKRIRLQREGPWHTIIGVSGDIRNSGLAPSADEYYLPRPHTENSRHAQILIRTSLTAQAMEPWFQQALHRLNPAIPAKLLPLSQRVESLAAQPRFEAVLLTLFASTGLVLSLLGLYGVMAYLVTQRTRELGVRLALGATHSNVILLFVRQALGWSAAGICVGLILSWLATAYLRAQLYEVSPRDPAVWAASVLLLLATALLAAWLPARRAGRIAPAEALRF